MAAGMNVLCIALGGAAGAVTRYGMGGLVHTALRSRPGEAFPWGTLLINISGCLLMGMLVPVLLERSLLRPELRMGVLVGFLGAYTTWSTFSYETLAFLNSGDFRRAFAYAVGTNIGCFLAVWAAYRVMHKILA